MCIFCIDSNANRHGNFIARRDFLKTAAAAATSVALMGLMEDPQLRADGEYSTVSAVVNSMKAERIARLTPIGYISKVATSNSVVKWVQLDLRQSHRIEYIKLMPLLDFGFNPQHFPSRFRVEVAQDANFNVAQTVVDHTHADYPSPGDKVAIFNGRGVRGRFVRLTATLLSDRALALSKFEVWSGGRDVAEGCPVTDIDSVEMVDITLGGLIPFVALAHGHGPDQVEYESLRKIYLGMPAYSNIMNQPGTVSPLTRKPRPQGEGVITDNPGNVIPQHLWTPVPLRASAPLRGVIVGEGLFRTVMENNISYLLNSFSVAEMLQPFRTRAGKPNPPGLPPPVPFWETGLPGACAGRFMMGSGNTLRWINHQELRRRLDEVVAGIAECQRPDGYAMAYPEDTIFYLERGAYTRSWVTHGLINAGYAGNNEAFRILRAFYDWFDQCPYLPQLLRRAGQGVQGMIANTRLYFTPVGEPKDMQIVQRYFQENYWIEGLAKRDPAAVWMYPYDHPHCYLLTSITPYLDLYRATGERKYLDAVLGGWELYHTQWQHIGGATSICEVWRYPPKSAFLHLENGENCGSSFWISLNHGLHQLFPNEEKYTNEIEKSLYNVLIANQDGEIGIRYHTNLDGRKEVGAAFNSCCEGQGTRQFGSLPEYVYSIADNGLYVNLFTNSSITWWQNRQSLQLRMSTEFPFNPAVKIRLSSVEATRANIRIRTPQWASEVMPIYLNGKLIATGKPGTYQLIDRNWTDGDTLSFTLPMDFRLTLYTGMDQLTDGLRYGLEYGPILLAIVPTNVADDVGVPPPPPTIKQREFARNLSWEDVQIPRDAEVMRAVLTSTEKDIRERLRPVKGKPLHFAIVGIPQFQYVPYFQINNEPFTCFPVLTTPESYTSEVVGQDDLALASKGATATSDSEYSSELGCTAKVIDGIIANPADFGSTRWRSADTPHPHWVQVVLPRMERIGRVVIDFADPLDHPTSFHGIMRVDGKDKVVFDVTNYRGWRNYTTDIEPVHTNCFRLVIRDSASPLHPNSAQISQVELYPAS